MFLLLIKLFSLRVFILLTVVYSLSCNERSGGQRKFLPKSGGGIGSVALVGEKKILNSDFGTLVKEHLGREVKGLPVPEPLFDISTINIEVFEGFVRQSRNILLIKEDTISSFFIKKNLFAKPQTIFNICGKNKNELKKVFIDNFPHIVDLLTLSERREKISRINLSLNKESILKDTLGINLIMPSVFTIGTQKSKHLFWARRKIKKGTSNILIYDVPYDRISHKNEKEIEYAILKIRDSIGKYYIHGPKSNMHFSRPVDLPYITREIKIDGRTSYETKGLWELTNFTMGGPFVNYFIEDVKNQRYIVIEGFVFAPREKKRNHLFEIESIAKSIEFL